MNLASLFSGGKDSAYATFRAIEVGHDIRYLVSVFPKSEESWMFHFPAIGLTKLQAKLIGKKHVIVKTKGEKEKELLDLRKALSKLKIDGVVSGAIASNYQKQRIDEICNKLGIVSLSPLWGRDPEKLLKEQLGSGFEMILTSVSAAGLDEGWLGRKIDEECINDLKKTKMRYGINMCGEGGEYDSFVTNCPLFSKEIKIKKSKKVWKRDRGYLEILEVE